MLEILDINEYERLEKEKEINKKLYNEFDIIEKFEKIKSINFNELYKKCTVTEIKTMYEQKEYTYSQELIYSDYVKLGSKGKTEEHLQIYKNDFKPFCSIHSRMDTTEHTKNRLVNKENVPLFFVPYMLKHTTAKNSGTCSKIEQHTKLEHDIKKIENIVNSFKNENNKSNHFLIDNIIKNKSENGKITFKNKSSLKNKEFNIERHYQYADTKGDTIDEILESKKDFILNIACDTEFQEYVYKTQDKKKHTVLLTVQFSFYYDFSFYTFVFTRLVANKPSGNRTSIERYLKVIFKFVNDKLFKINSDKKQKKLNVCLLFHYGKADLTHFREFSLYAKKGLSNVQGGIYSIVKLSRKLINHKQRATSENYSYNYSLSVADTMAIIVGDKSLAVQTKDQFFKKLEEIDIDKSKMIDEILKNTNNFFKYACNDTLATLELFAKNYGFNCKYPISIGSDAVDIFIKEFMYETYGIRYNNKELFKLTYSGLYKVNEHKEKGENGKLKDVEEYAYIDSTIEQYKNIIAKSFKGGMNQCYYSGVVKGLTLDTDLRSAYPLAMSMILRYNPNGTSKVYTNIENMETLEILKACGGFFNICTAVVDFDFTNTTHEDFPNIAVKQHDNLIFPLTGENETITGAELFIALNAGAIKKIHTLIVPNTFKDEYVFKGFYKKLIKLRNEMKQKYGKKSIQQEIIKLICNALYGKTAQGISGARTYNSTTDSYIEMPVCPVTFECYASAITGIIRCLVNEHMRILSKHNKSVYSVTTDGFISDSYDIKELEKWLNEDYITSIFIKDLIKTCAELQEEKELSNIVEIKHRQDFILNPSTRFNLGLKSDELKKIEEETKEILQPVEAHGGSKFLKKIQKQEDKIEWILYNRGEVPDSFFKAPSFRELCTTDAENVFEIQDKRAFLEFDYKNIPIWQTLEEKEIIINDKVYKKPSFDTRPPKDKEEFIRIKNLSKKYKNGSWDINKLIEMKDILQNKKKEKTIKKDNRSKVQQEYKDLKLLFTYFIFNNYKFLNKDLDLFFSELDRKQFVNRFNFVLENFKVDKKFTIKFIENTQLDIKKNKVYDFSNINSILKKYIDNFLKV